MLTRIPIGLFTLIRILLPVKMLQICHHWSTDHSWLKFELSRIRASNALEFFTLIRIWIQLPKIMLIWIRIRNSGFKRTTQNLHKRMFTPSKPRGKSAIPDAQMPHIPSFSRAFCRQSVLFACLLCDTFSLVLPDQFLIPIFSKLFIGRYIFALLLHSGCISKLALSVNI